MTLDEAIKHAEEVAEEQEKAAKEWHENQVIKCELIPFAEMDYTHENECKECTAEHRQLAEWLKDYKRLLEQETCEDAISRKEVIDTIYHECSVGNLNIDFVKVILLQRKIKALPSVNPQPCEDAISRQAVLDLVCADWKYENLEADIASLPPVTPQPKMGHWIIIDDCEQFIAKCSECGRIEDSRMINKYPYCHCGAKMIESEENE